MEKMLQGVVGVLGPEIPAPERRRVLRSFQEKGLGGIEIRADLFENPEEALSCLKDRPKSLKAIFTIRNSFQGGNFRESEDDRVALYRRALLEGAEYVDAEWGTPAAQALSAGGAPIIVSHHDFQGTPPLAEIEELSRSMGTAPCAAVKLVTTARRLGDALRVIEFLEGAPSRTPLVAFSMGEVGFASRALAIARGSPLTYGSIGRPVAPGQVTALELLEVYRPQLRGASTRVLGVVGNPVRHSLSPHLHNPALAARRIDTIYLPLLLESIEELGPALDPLRIDGLSVTIPFKEDALRLADRADERARRAGAANTLKVERDAEGRRTAILAYNTDVEGVLGPLKSRVGDLRGLRAAVVGNGGAARGAVQALLEGGASPTLYYRNEARGDPVAASLGVPGKPIAAMKRGAQKVIVNATSLGLTAGDPSPVDPAVFSQETIAFEMVYDPPETRFLEDARLAGATRIGGREMLVSQALEQFRIFTGQTATYEELDENFGRGQALRSAK